MNSTEKLITYLLDTNPELDKFYQVYLEEWGEKPPSEYSVLAWIVKPYIKDLYKANNRVKLIEIWNTLEHIAKDWGDPARNEIYVVITEEIELYKHHEYLGPTLKEQWLKCLAWYPMLRTRDSPINRHVDTIVYRKRWITEIKKIGGFGELDEKNESEIHNRLRKEFSIKSD